MTARGTAFFTIGVAAGLAAGWLAFPAALYERVEQPVAFSHRAHGPEGAGMACQDCHALRPDGRFAGIPALDGCAACHSEPLGSSPAEARLVEEYVRPGREIPWLSYSRQPDNAHFPHAPHLTRAGLACERCHGPHGASEALPAVQVNRLSGYAREVSKMSACSDCHRESGVSESCVDCHK